MSEASTTRTPLLLVRHGETPWNREGRWQGQADPPLTPQGQAQAQALASALAARSSRPWSRIVTSDLCRASQTANALAEALSLPLELDRRLRERDVPGWSGRLREEIERTDPLNLRAFLSGDPSVRPGGGETDEELVARGGAAIKDLVQRFAGESLILVSHLGWINALVPEVRPGNAEATEVDAEQVLARLVPSSGGRKGSGDLVL